MAFHGLRFHPSDPAKLRGAIAFAAELAARDFLAFENKLHFEVDLFVRPKTQERAERLVGGAVGQKIEIVFQIERADADSRAGLLVPDFVADNGAEAQLLRGRGALADTALGGGVQAEPAPNQLNHLNGDFKIIVQEQLESVRGMRALPENACEKKKCVVG